ncbi:hypothetical protein D041_0468A, partial [Vibrio parahaemolyticus EKP-008]
MHKAPH